MSNRPYKFTLPDEAPDGTVCYQFTVPNQLHYRVAFATALYALTNWFDWERDDAKRGKDIADEFRAIIEAGLGDSCEAIMGLMDVRQNSGNPCHLEKTEDGEIWVMFANLRLCKPKMRIGIDGVLEWFDPVSETWQDLEDENESPLDIPEPDDYVFPEPGNEQCLASVAVEAAMKAAHAELFRATLTGFAVTAVTACVVAAVGAILSNPMWLVDVEVFSTLVAEVLEAVTDNYGDRLLSYNWKEFRCMIYELMPADGILTQSAYDAMLAEMITRIDDEIDILNTAFFGFVGFNGMKKSIATHVSLINQNEQCCQDGLFYGTAQEVEQYKQSTAGTMTMQFRWPDVKYRTVGYRVDVLMCVQTGSNQISIGTSSVLGSGFLRTGNIGSVIGIPGNFECQINYLSFPGANIAEKTQAARDAMDILLGDGQGQLTSITNVSADGDAGADGYVEALEDFQADLVWGANASGRLKCRVRPIHKTV